MADHTLADLHADPRNARKHNSRNVGMIERALSEVGAARSIVVDEDGTVLAGNATIEAEALAGIERVQFVDADGETLIAVRRTGLTPEQKTRLALFDNRAAELAEWDGDVLGEIAAENDALLEGMFGDGELDALLESIQPEVAPARDPGPQIDRADELLEKWGVERGQVWDIPSRTAAGKSHRLICGDSTSAEDVARLMQGRRATLFATDPPYLVGYDGTNHPHEWGSTEPESKNKDWSADYHDWDGLTDEEGAALYRDFIGVAIEQAIKDKAAWYLWHASKRRVMLELIWEEFGAFVHQEIIWAKNRAVLTHSHYMWQTEPCLFGWIKGQKPHRRASDYPTNLWRIDQEDGERLHPTVKPVECFKIPIAQHTLPGQICYELFSGSGTQFAAAESLGRLCYGIELEPKYVSVALERMAGMGLSPREQD